MPEIAYATEEKTHRALQIGVGVRRDAPAAVKDAIIRDVTVGAVGFGEIEFLIRT